MAGVRKEGAARRRVRATREILLAVALTLTVWLLALRVEGFRSSRVLTLLLSHDWLAVGLISLGMTYVILTAGIDLSVGSTLALSAMAFGLAWQRMYSAAGHDAQNLTAITESGMVFIPSLGGRSHRVDEMSSWDAIERGGNVLVGALVTLAS